MIIQKRTYIKPEIDFIPIEDEVLADVSAGGDNTGPGDGVGEGEDEAKGGHFDFNFEEDNDIDPFFFDDF